MAFIALHRSVRAKKREAILVIFYLLDGSLPPADGMALRAIGAEFAAVNVCMAIGAGFANVSEDRLYVTLCTLNFFVHTAEGVICAVVIEFQIGANRAPTACSMAIFARSRKRSVGTAGPVTLTGGGKSEPR